MLFIIKVNWIIGDLLSLVTFVILSAAHVGCLMCGVKLWLWRQQQQQREQVRSRRCDLRETGNTMRQKHFTAQEACELIFNHVAENNDHEDNADQNEEEDSGSEE